MSDKRMGAKKHQAPRAGKGRPQGKPAGKVQGTSKKAVPKKQPRSAKIKAWPKSVLPSGASVTPDGVLHIQFRRRAKGPSAALPHPFFSKQQLTKLGVTAHATPLGNEMQLDKVEVMAGGPKPPSTAGLAPCAQAYAKAISNPFGSFEDLPCVPASPPAQTQKWRTVQRGVFVTSNTTGWGYLIVCPYTPAKDTTKYYSSTNATTFVSAKSSNFQTAVAGVTAQANGALPYTAAQMTSGLQARLVGLGIRVRNISQAMNVGGTLVVGQLASNQSAGFISGTTFETNPDAVIIPQVLQEQNAWTILVWRPNEMSDLDWMPDDNLALSANITLIISANAPAPATVQSFEWEIVEFWEYVGQSNTTTLPGTTLTEADTVGLDRVLTAAQRLPLSCEKEDWANQMAHGLVDAMAHSDSTAKTVEDLTGGQGLDWAKIINLVVEVGGYLLA